MEKKVPDKIIKIFVGVLTLLFSILVIRLGYMQIIEANRYRTLATQNHQRLNPVQAPRGEIVDRNGVRMVMNKPVYTISMVYLGKTDNRVVNLLSGLLEGDPSMNGLPLSQIQLVIMEKIKEHQRLYEPVRVAVNVSQETVNKIEEQRIDLPGVVIDVEPVRLYPYGDLLGEVLGYVREITGEQLESHQDQDYQMGDSFGQTGLEYTYESYLRGKNGARQVEVDAQGNPVRDLGYKSPISGNNLVTSIDYRVQKAAQEAVAAAVQQTKSGFAKVPAGTPVSGAAVAIDVRTGEVIAMASIPSYDLNIFSQPLQVKQYNELLKAGALRNHAIQSTYTPGSTFKMATLSALLEGKIVTPQTTIYDPGYYKYKKDWKPGGHGAVNAVGAIKNSCDTYFYQFGIQAGPDLMGKFAAEYGLGQRTGIDLPGEETGRLASKALKQKIWQGNEWESKWREYDSMDMAIGQQETKLTAIQLANYVAAIANGGTVYKPHLVKKIVDSDGAEIKVFNPEVMNKANVSKETLDVVREGMREVASAGGTGSAAFSGAQYSAAAKTGTAEVGDKAQNAHALFVAYAPYENPEVALSVVIEYGAHGSSTGGPVARKMLDAYFQAKKEDAAGIHSVQSTNEQSVPEPANHTSSAVNSAAPSRPKPAAKPSGGGGNSTGQDAGPLPNSQIPNGNREDHTGIVPPSVPGTGQSEQRQNSDEAET